VVLPLLTSSRSSSSYECDGCNHHASFHNMENKIEDEIRKKWAQEAKDKAEQDAEAAQRPRKRPRAIGYRNDADDVMNDLALGVLSKGTAVERRSSTKSKGDAAKPRRNAGARARSRITEITGDDEGIVELD